MPKLNYSDITRYIFLLGPVGIGLLQVDAASYHLLVALALMVMITSQMRLVIKHSAYVTALILLEILLVLYLSHLYQGFFVLMLFTPLIDSVSRLKSEAYPLSLLIGMALVFGLNRQHYPLDLVLVIVIFYAATLFFLLQLKKEADIRVDTEILYDRLRQNNYELEAARIRLLEYSRQVERITQLEERNRISRELHDSIGHSLTGVLMQVDAARQLLKVDPVKGFELLDAAYENINNSIETVRQTVRKIKPPSFQNHLASLREMVSKFKQESRVDVKLNSSGTPYQLFPSVEIALYRNIQEALTNSVRHGKASSICIELAYKPEYLEVVISDNGLGAKEINKGFGLSGMEERLELIGGTISYSGDNGFSLQMYIPRREL